MTLGVCGSYFVFIASTMAGISDIPVQGWLLATLLVTAALCQIDDVSYLAPCSAVGLLALLLAVATTSIDAEYQSQSRSSVPSIANLPVLRDFPSYLLFLGNAGYLYLISTAVLPIYQNMKKQQQQQQQQQQGQERPQLEEHETYRVLSDSHASNSAQQIKFRSAFNLSIIAVTVLNVVFALHAWKSYGDCTAQDDKSKLRCVQPNVIDNLKPGASSTTVKVLLCCDLLFTSVLFLFPINEALERELGIGVAMPSPGNTNRKGVLTTPASTSVLLVQNPQQCGETTEGVARVMGRRILRCFMVLAVAGVAFTVPDFSLLTGLTGAFGNNILGLILPPLFYWRLRSRVGMPVRFFRDLRPAAGCNPPSASASFVSKRPKKIILDGPLEGLALLVVLVFGLWFLAFSTSASLVLAFNRAPRPR